MVRVTGTHSLGRTSNLLVPIPPSKPPPGKAYHEYRAALMVKQQRAASDGTSSRLEMRRRVTPAGGIFQAEELDSSGFHGYTYVMNNQGSVGAVTTTVSALSDDRLLERTKELSRIEHHLEVVVIDHLREIHKRRLYLRRGFSRPVRLRGGASWVTATPRRGGASRRCASARTWRGVRERLREWLDDAERGRLVAACVRPAGAQEGTGGA